MKLLCGLALAAMLGVHGIAAAQLKPSGSQAPTLPPGPAEVLKKDAQDAKELAARYAAERWLALLDAGEFGKAWDQCARLFRERVKREQWVKELPAKRGALGAMRERRTEVASYKASLPGAPDGEYVTVRFSTDFEKKKDAQELVTLVYEDGAWRPLGYVPAS